MTRGIACFTPNCTVRMHLHCFNSYRKRNNGCPSCSQDWPRDVKDKKLVPVGEEAAKEGDGVNRVGCIEAAEEDERGDECEGREGYVVKRVDAARNVRMWM